MLKGKKAPSQSEIQLPFFILGTAILLPIVSSFFAYPLSRNLLWLSMGFSSEPLTVQRAATISFSFSLFFCCCLFFSMGVAPPYNNVMLSIVADFFILCFCLLPFTLIFELLLLVDDNFAAYLHYFSPAAFTILIVYIIAGTIHGLALKEKHISVKSSKLSAPLTIVQISDVHLGSHSMKSFQSKVNRINATKPDIVCITGDLLDSSNVMRLHPISSPNAATSLRLSPQQCAKLDLDPSYAGLVPHKQILCLRNLHAKYGVFYVTGNHDVMFNPHKVHTFLKYFPNITDLKNAFVDVQLECQRKSGSSKEDLVRIIGIQDSTERVFESAVQTMSSTLRDRQGDTPFTILLHHRPHRHAWMKALRTLGADMMLAGHTHSGQIFPFNLVVPLQFNPLRGLCLLSHYTGHKSPSHIQGNEVVNEPFMYISPGTGTWGTTMRTQDTNEITIFQLSPTK